jgi:hypothetical protein
MAQYKGPPEMEPLLLDGDDYFSILFPTTVQAPTSSHSRELLMHYCATVI